MPYVGNQPSGNFVQVTSQTITGNGGATYTLDRPAGNSAEIEVFVNHVRQDPASYSVTGTSLTLGGNITSSDSCYVVFQSAGVGTVSHPATNNLQAADGTFSGSATITGDLTVDTNTLHVDSTNNRVGVGDPTPADTLGVEGNLRLNTGASTTRRVYALGGEGAYSLGTSGGAAVAFHRLSNNSDELAFETHDQGNSHFEMMRLDRHGRVTMPKQPAFYAHRNGGDWTTAVNQRIAFTSTKHNVGNGYSTSTYQFTAPVSGRYFFGGQMWAKNNGGMSRWHFEINGTHHGQFGSHAAPQDSRIGGSGVFNLSANDYVTMVTDQTGLTAHAGGTNSHSYFYGYLIG